MKGANLVSRTSEMMNKNKDQPGYKDNMGLAKEEVIIVDKPVLQKDELKKVQVKGEGYRNMDEHRIDLN